MFERKKGFVSIWVGEGLPKAVFEKYAVHEYGDPNEDKPLNEFARDAGDMWFDHDFVAAQWYRGKDRSIEEALEGFSGAEFFTAEAARLAKEKRVPTVNCVVVMYDSVLTPRPLQLPGKRKWPFARTAGIWPKGSPLVFLGTLPCTEIKSIPDRPELRKDDHTKELRELSISPDGRFGLSFSSDEVIRLWDLESGAHIGKHKAAKPISFITWMGDSRGFVTASMFPEWKSGKGEYELTIWRADATALAKQKTLKTTEKADPVERRPATNTSERESAMLFPDGKRLVWGADQLLVADSDNWKASTLHQPESPIQSKCALRDGRLLTVDEQGNCNVWDPSLTKVVSKSVLPAITSLGQLSENEIVMPGMVVNFNTGKTVRKLKRYMDLFVQGFVGPAKEKRWAEIGASTIQVSSLESGERIFKTEFDETEMTGAAAAKAGLIATVSHHANLHVWDVDAGRRTATWREAPTDRTVENKTEDGDGYELTAVAISPDGKKIMVGESSGRVFIFRHDRGKLKRLR